MLYSIYSNRIGWYSLVLSGRTSLSATIIYVYSLRCKTKNVDFQYSLLLPVNRKRKLVININQTNNKIIICIIIVHSNFNRNPKRGFSVVPTYYIIITRYNNTVQCNIPFDKLIKIDIALNVNPAPLIYYC